MQTILLASASPRRRALLALGGWTFETRPAQVDETPLPSETPEAFVIRLSQAKARRAAQQAARGVLVVGCDTTVVLDDRLLNKPADAAEAKAMLHQLRGRTHDVLTALTVIDTASGRLDTDLARSRVPMRDYSQAEIDAYVASGDPLDKAGGYAIQHPDFQPVDRDRFAECFANVMGLPLCHLLRRLRALGRDALTDLPAECQRFIPYQCPVSDAILSEAPA